MPEKILKIDMHTHILPPEIPKFKNIFGYGGFIELQKISNQPHVNMVSDEGVFFRKVDANTFDPLVRLKECDCHGIHVQVLSTIPVMFSYWTKPKDGLYISQFLNDHIANVVASNPKRFIGLGTLPMQDVKLAIQEAKRCKDQLHLPGFQIGSNINGKNLSEKEFFPLYAELEKLEMALFVHPWEMMGEKQMQKYWLPWLVGMPAETARAICSMIFGGVFEQFPNLKVAFAHAGGSFPMTLPRIEHGFKVRPDLCAIDCKKSPRDFCGHFYVDSLTHDPEILKYLIDLFGSDKIFLGTDYPFPLGELTPGAVIENANLESKTKEDLYHLSVLNWLGLSKQQFV